MQSSSGYAIALGLSSALLACLVLILAMPILRTPSHQAFKNVGENAIVAYCSTPHSICVTRMDRTAGQWSTVRVKLKGCTFGFQVDILKSGHLVIHDTHGATQVIERGGKGQSTSIDWHQISGTEFCFDRVSYIGTLRGLPSFFYKTIGCNSTNRRSGLVSFDTETGRLLNPYQARSREVIDHVLGAFSTGLIIQGHTTNEAPKNSRARMDNEERTAVKHNFLAFINRNGSELWRTSISSNLVLSQAKLSIDMKKLGLIASRRKGHVTTPTVGEREVWVVGAQSGEVLADVDLPPSTSTPIPVSPGLGTILTCYDPGFCYWTSASELVFISAGLSGILDTQRPEAEGGKELSSTRYELLDSTPRLRESYDAITSMLIDARPVTLPTTRIANGVFLHLSREGELFGSDNHNRDFGIKDVRDFEVIPVGNF
jgi:hypothetical protein